MRLKITTPVGAVFGRWTVVGRDLTRPPADECHWICICECGTIRSVRRSRLLKAVLPSCGCLAREHVAQRNYVHGRSATPEYRAWSSMRTRCSNPKARWWPRYGGRGITVDVSWETFEQFLLDMGPRPSPQHSLDRVDNDGPYAPWNCRWATSRQQCRNKSTNHLLTHNGVTLAVVEWSEILGIREDTLLRRIRKGWSAEQTLSTPLLRKRKAKQLSLLE